MTPKAGEWLAAAAPGRGHGDDRIEYVVADLFEYQPDGDYDLIFAGYWLSHVPPGRFASFWSMLSDALAPGGSVVMVDDGVRRR